MPYTDIKTDLILNEISEEQLHSQQSLPPNQYWLTPDNETKENTSILYETTGQNTDGAMTQKAVTDELSRVASRVTSLETNVEFVKGDTSWYLKTKDGFWLCGIQCDGTTSSAGKTFSLPITFEYGQTVTSTPVVGQNARLMTSIVVTFEDVILVDTPMKTATITLRTDSTNAYRLWVIVGGTFG